MVADFAFDLELHRLQQVFVEMELTPQAGALSVGDREDRCREGSHRVRQVPAGRAELYASRILRTASCLEGLLR